MIPTTTAPDPAPLAMKTAKPPLAMVPNDSVQAAQRDQVEEAAERQMQAQGYGLCMLSCLAACLATGPVTPACQAACVLACLAAGPCFANGTLVVVSQEGRATSMPVEMVQPGMEVATAHPVSGIQYTKVLSNTAISAQRHHVQVCMTGMIDSQYRVMGGKVPVLCWNAKSGRRSPPPPPF